MKVKLIWNREFEKQLRKKLQKDPQLKEKFWSMLEIFEKNPFDPRLKTHKLTGELRGLWAFRITYNHRVVFKLIERGRGEYEAILIDIGTHDEVY